MKALLFSFFFLLLLPFTAFSQLTLTVSPTPIPGREVTVSIDNYSTDSKFHYEYQYNFIVFDQKGPQFWAYRTDRPIRTFLVPQDAKIVRVKVTELIFYKSGDYISPSPFTARSTYSYQTIMDL